MQDERRPDETNKKSRSWHAFVDSFCHLALVKPFDKIRVREICESAGYSNMAFYSNFNNKDDLARSVVEDAADQHVQFVLAYAAQLPTGEDIGVRSLMFDFVLQFIEYVRCHSVQYEVILKRNIVDNPTGCYTDRYVSQLDNQIYITQSGSETSYYSPFRQTMGIMLLLSTIAYWMGRDDKPSPADFANSYCDLFFAQQQNVQLSDEAEPPDGPTSHPVR